LIVVCDADSIVMFCAVMFEFVSRRSVDAVRLRLVVPLLLPVFVVSWAAFSVRFMAVSAVFGFSVAFAPLLIVRLCSVSAVISVMALVAKLLLFIMRSASCADGLRYIVPAAPSELELSGRSWPPKAVIVPV